MARFTASHQTFTGKDKEINQQSVHYLSYAEKKPEEVERVR
jgi:hypothetical protein